MLFRLLNYTFILCLLSTGVLAAEELKGRAEMNWRYGTVRTILMSEFWAPIWQDDRQVLYGDLRLTGDDKDGREGNIGIGYRQLLSKYDGIIGVHLWLDRRITELGSHFHQLALGGEWLGKWVDFRANGYLPLNSEKEYTTPNTGNASPYFSGTGILVDTTGKLIEEPQHGFDLELGWAVPLFEKTIDDFRVYGGVYYFDGDYSERVTGWRTRFTMDITPDFQIGARFQSDDERGSQGFLEATIRFPFGQKKSYRREGLRARLDETPERDIDIVTGATVTDTGRAKPVINTATNQPQQVLHVDNTAAPGGDGSADKPYNTLAQAESASTASGIIYVHEGDGTSSGQDQGITLNKIGQKLIGAGIDFIWDGSVFGINSSSQSRPDNLIIAPATNAPVISNTNADGDGITVSANDVTVAGVAVNGASRDGIVIRASGAGASATNVTITDVSATGNRTGIYIHGADDGAVSAKVQRSITSANSQHGIAVYDDTDSAFEVDLGGGAFGSLGLNVLAGNTLEELAVEYDGRLLAAMNNWWGSASGPDTDDPSDGVAPQIYYGAPLHDGLFGHWTFDAEWTSNTTAYDRSGNGHDGTLLGGLNLSDMAAGQRGEALNFNGTSDYVEILGMPVNLAEYSVLTWVSPDMTAGGNADQNNFGFTVLADGAPAGAGSYPVWITLKSGEVVSRMFNTSTVGQSTAGAGIANSTWQSVEVTAIKGGQSVVYVDGEEESNFVNPGNSGNWSNGRLYIGDLRAGRGIRFDGLIDDVRAYDRVLTSSEIAELYRMDTSSMVDTTGFLAAAP